MDSTPRKKLVKKNYQHAAIAHLIAHKKCALWAGMGTGKTVCVLTALDALSYGDPDTFPALIIAPLRVAQNTWPDELQKWDHLEGLTMVRVLGDEQDRFAALRKKADIYVINFENLEWLVAKFGKKWPFKTVVVDEATKLKGHRLRRGTRRPRALAMVMPYIKRLIELSGTPSPNGLKDLWGQIWFLDEGQRLGRTFQSFTDRWFEGVPFKQFEIKPREYAHEEIHSRIGDICLSIEGKDYFDLKEPIENFIYVDLPPKARRLYTEMEKRMYMELEELGESVEAVSGGVKIMKCHQIANGAVYLNEDTKEWAEVHDEKLKALESIIEEACGMPVLVAYKFKSDLYRLKKRFPQGTTLANKDDAIKKWNEGKTPLLFVHPASAGHGLNLQDGSNILAFYSVDWNLEEHMQVIERIGPMRQLQSGHDRPVYIHYILAKNTVDDQLIMPRLKTKRSVQEILMEAMKRRNG